MPYIEKRKKVGRDALGIRYEIQSVYITPEEQRKRDLASASRQYERMGYNSFSGHSLEYAYDEVTRPDRYVLGQLHMAKGLLKHINERYQDEKGHIDDKRIIDIKSKLWNQIFRAKAQLNHEEAKRIAHKAMQKED